jgi:hypothetical protein
VYVVGYVCAGCTKYEVQTPLLNHDRGLAPRFLADDVLANDISRSNGTQSFVPTYLTLF